MRTRGKRMLAASAALAVMTLTACTATGPDYPLAGKVDDATVTVAAPALSVPRPNLDAGFPATDKSTDTVSGPAVRAVTGLGSVQRVSRVHVAVGDQVEAGDALVDFDDTSLRAGIVAARADAALAEAQIPVLDHAIRETYDKQQEVRDKRAEVRRAISQLSSTRRQVAAKLAQARAMLPQLRAKQHQVARALPKVTAGLRKVSPKLSALRAQLAKVERALASVPPMPPGVPEPPQVTKLKQARAKLKAAVSQLSSVRNRLAATRAKLLGARRQLRTAVAKLSAAIPKMRAGLARIASGLAKARDGVRKLNTAEARIIDARGTLRNLKAVAKVAVDLSEVGVTVARQQRSLVTVTAPTAGIVTRIADVGAVLAPAATVAGILPDEPATLTTWVTLDEAARLCRGDRVEVRGDWMPPAASSEATVTVIGLRAEPPPTSHPTDLVHLIRAIPLTLTVSDGSRLPAGVPVQLRLHPCKPSEAKDPSDG